MRAFISPAMIPSVVKRQHISQKSVALRNRYIRRVAAVLACGVMMSLVFVWTRVRVIQLGYEVTRLHREVDDLGHRREKLEAEVAEFKSPDRLERIARERFGMRSPNGNEIVLVEP